MADIEQMVERISWMSPIDYAILEFFEDHDIIVSPNILHANLGYEQQYIGRRCRLLAQNEILDRPGRGHYELSDKGRDFLAGKIDPSEFEDA